jgi:hypothetical protein
VRYVGLVFLGLVLSAGQASAEVEVLKDRDAVKILRDGKILTIQAYQKGFRTKYGVIYKDQYFFCFDDHYFNDKPRTSLNCYGTPDDK